MPSSRSTFFFLAALALLGPVAITQPANALQAMGPPPARRAEHINVAHKMIRKRSASPRVVPVRRQNPQVSPPGSAPAPSATDGLPSNLSTPGTTTTSIAASSAPASAPATPTSQQQPATTPTARTSSSSTTVIQTTSTSASTTRPTTTSAPSTTSSSTQQATVTASTSNTPSSAPQDTAIQASSTQTSSRSTVLITTTSTQGSAPQASDKSKDEGASFLPKPVIVSLIVAAACVVGAAAIWTIIRKWKFGASRQFEDRLEPVNWEPPATGGVPMHEHDPAAVAIARGNSVNSHARSSFGSSDGTHSSGRNMTAVGDQSVSVAPDLPPPHDFTAGPAHLAPGPGYADLQRGPSPTPSMNYGGYGQQQYPAPNPYDTYDYQGAYGAYGGVQPPLHDNGPGPHQF